MTTSTSSWSHKDAKDLQKFLFCINTHTHTKLCGEVGYLGGKLDSFHKDFPERGCGGVPCAGGGHQLPCTHYSQLQLALNQSAVHQSIDQSSIWWLCSCIFKTEWQLQERGEMKEKWKKTFLGTWLETRFPCQRRYASKRAVACG